MTHGAPTEIAIFNISSKSLGFSPRGIGESLFTISGPNLEPSVMRDKRTGKRIGTISLKNGDSIEKIPLIFGTTTYIYLLED
jgi:hypothetical protein